MCLSTTIFPVFCFYFYLNSLISSFLFVFTLFRSSIGYLFATLNRLMCLPLCLITSLSVIITSISSSLSPKPSLILILSLLLMFYWKFTLNFPLFIILIISLPSCLSLPSGSMIIPSLLPPFLLLITQTPMIPSLSFIFLLFSLFTLVRSLLPFFLSPFTSPSPFLFLSFPFFSPFSFTSLLLPPIPFLPFLFLSFPFPLCRSSFPSL